MEYGGMASLMQAVIDVETAKLFALKPSLGYLMAATRYSREVIGDWRSHYVILRDILLFTWIFNAFNWGLLGGSLRYMCLPRRTIGLIGMPITPLVHSNINHLFGNSLYFVILGWLILLRGVPDFIIVTLVVALTDSIGTWIFAQGGVPNYGASGIVYGYFSFLLFSSFFERDIVSLILTIFVGIFFWRWVPALFREERGVSLEGHMFGFFGGIMAVLALPALRELWFGLR